MPDRAGRRRPSWLADAALALAFMLCGGAFAGAAHLVMSASFLEAPLGNDVWFEGDLPQVADTMLHRWSDQPRNDHHPLFALVTAVPAYALGALGLNDNARLTVLVTAAGALWCGSVFLLLRLLTPGRADAAIFTLLALTSAASVFWLPVTDTFALGSITILAPLVVVAWNARSPVSDRWYVAASVLALSITTTNWTAGIAAAGAGRRLRSAVQITANALAIVVALWGVEKTFAPLYPFFIGGAGRSRFFFPSGTGGPLAILRVLFMHAIVMPRLQLSSDPKWGALLSVQHASAGSSGSLGITATLVWTALLGAGMWGLARGSLHPRIRLALALTLAAQCAVYLCYGEETFLYTLHVAPLLVACAATATTTSLRPWACVVAAVLAVLLAANNVPLFLHAAQFFVWGGR